MYFRAIEELETHLGTAFGTVPPTVSVELCPADFSGDVTVNCFRLARSLRNAPPKIAAEVQRFLSDHPDVESAETIKAFVNVTLKPPALFRDCVADEAALFRRIPLPESERKRVLIEFSAPNTNKPQHLGHVRNNTLGQAITEILRAVGHQPIPINLVNDRGIHICKSMLAYQRWGNGITPETAERKGDHLVGDFYVRYDTEYRRQLAELREANPKLRDASDDELFLKTELGRAAQDMLLRWEDGDPDVRALWETMNAWVLEGFRQTYERMGVQFEHTYLESQTYGLGKDVVRKGLADGIFHERDDGAVCVNLEEEKLDTKVLLRSDGTSVYITQDLGTTLLKQRDYQPASQMWIVGDEQIRHFQVLFAILRRLGYEWADNLVHMAYGMVNLPSGKMKSREGTVVDADDLFDEMVRLARAATLERAGGETPDDIDRRAEIIGMGALKFMLLKVNAKTTLMFDPEASIRFEGDTGPYVLYAAARISSMLRKAEEEKPDDGAVDWSALQTVEERDLALRCAAYPDSLRKAAADLDTSALAAHLLELAKAFSRFYRECPVLNAPTPALRHARLELSRRVRRLLEHGLETLTIGHLESM